MEDKRGIEGWGRWIHWRQRGGRKMEGQSMLERTYWKREGTMEVLVQEPSRLWTPCDSLGVKGSRLELERDPGPPSAPNLALPTEGPVVQRDCFSPMCWEEKGPCTAQRKSTSLGRAPQALS